MSLLLDCEKCMQTTSQISRQAMGCGYEPPAPPLVQIRIWDHPRRRRDDPSDAPTVCPGYSCSLPIVRETSFARMHWKQNQATTWARGDVTELQLRAIEVLESSTRELDAWVMTPPEKGGPRS